MKFSENWLRTFVNPPLATRELAHALTMAGLEVEAIEPAAPPFDSVVVGEVLKVEHHPDADAPDGVPGQRRRRAAHDRLRRAQRASRASRCRPRCPARACRARRSGSPKCAASNRTACSARPRSWACADAVDGLLVLPDDARSARACAKCSISTTSCSPRSPRPIAATA